MQRVKGKKRPISLGSIPLSKFKRIVDSLENGPIADPMISFEFICRSFFPEVPKNMANNLAAQYDLGFRDGYAEGRKAALEDTKKLP